MPTPKKEQFIQRHRHRLGVPAVISVGGSLDVLTGRRWRAPGWMQRCGLEWLARLLQEPIRLGPKFLVGNTHYLLLLLAALARTRLRRLGLCLPSADQQNRAQTNVAPQDLTYVAITPVRDDRAGLCRVFGCLQTQACSPLKWIIVDNGSTDGTHELAARLAQQHSWIEQIMAPGSPRPQRGGTVTRAFELGQQAIAERVDVVIKVDADVSFDRSHFQRIIETFASDDDIGLVSGVQLEFVRGAWRPQYAVGTMVAAPIRAYRWECFTDVTPLERCVGWDGIDHVKAINSGWKTRVLAELFFNHHRREGERDGRRTYWQQEGRAAYFIGYRPLYLLIKALFRARREPAALALIVGYYRAWIARLDRCADRNVIDRVREGQRVRHLPTRVRQALGGGFAPVRRRASRAEV